MSDFTQADAEAAGWQFVHAEPERLEYVGAELIRVVPGQYRAEKYVNSSLVNEVGETPEQLLTRISLYEDHLAGLPQAVPAPVDTGDLNPTVEAAPAPVPVEEPAPTVQDVNGNALDENGQIVAPAPSPVDTSAQDAAETQAPAEVAPVDPQAPAADSSSGSPSDSTASTETPSEPSTDATVALQAQIDAGTPAPQDGNSQ